MNHIQRLQQWIEEHFPGLHADLDAPGDPEGEWWLDLEREGRRVTVQWRPDRGFGLSASLFEAGYGEGPDEVVETLEQAKTRLSELLNGDWTRPPTEVALHELRARALDPSGRRDPLGDRPSLCLEVRTS